MAFDQYVEVFLNGNFDGVACLADCELEFLKLKNLIENNKIIVAKRGVKAFDKLNILPLFCEIFSEKFAYYLEKFPVLKYELDQKGISHDLVEELTKNSTCYDFSESIYEIYNKHASFIDHFSSIQRQTEECEQWIHALEFLNLMYEITHFLSKGQLLDKSDNEHQRVYTRSPQIDWCAFCFRRVKSIGEQRPLQTLSNMHDQVFPENKSRKSKQLLCKKHESSKKNDSNYRNAKKLVSTLSPEDIMKIDEIRAYRRVNEVMMFKKEINTLEFENQWQKNKSIWLGYLQDLCPFIDVSDISTWEKFTDKFHKSLQNDLETTKIPVNIQDIYFEAKIWGDFKKRYLELDKRRKKKV